MDEASRSTRIEIGHSAELILRRPRRRRHRFASSAARRPPHEIPRRENPPPGERNNPHPHALRRRDRINFAGGLEATPAPGQLPPISPPRPGGSKWKFTSDVKMPHEIRAKFENGRPLVAEALSVDSLCLDCNCNRSRRRTLTTKPSKRPGDGVMASLADVSNGSGAAVQGMSASGSPPTAAVIADIAAVRFVAVLFDIP